MSLGPKALADLLDILTEEQCRTQSFETLCNKSHHCFKKEEKIVVGKAILFFMQDRNILPTLPQLLVATVLLHDLYRRDAIEHTPFLLVFIHLMTVGLDSRALAPDVICGINTHAPVPANAAKPSDGIRDNSLVLSVSEQIILRRLPKFGVQARNFLSQLITRNPKDLLKKTAMHVVNCDPETYGLADISNLIKAAKDRQLDCLEIIMGISTVVSDPESDDEDDGKPQNVEQIYKRLVEPYFFGNDKTLALRRLYVPDLLRMAPPLAPPDNELCWFTTYDPSGHKIVYNDTKLKRDNPRDPEAKALMSKAFKGMLPPKEQQQLVGMLETDPKLVHHIGLTAKKFLELVENNPMVAVDVLLNMMKCEYKHIADYFSVLVNMEMSLHSMEVVNRLTTRVDLPKEFIHLYVNNCITTCEGIKDRYMQSRLVRLVCVFMQSLIRNKIVNARDVYNQVEAFCIEFSRIREASALYKLLKNLDLGPSGRPVNTTTTAASTTNTTNARGKKTPNKK